MDITWQSDALDGYIMKREISIPPHTICETIRETLSTIPEKSEKEIYSQIKQPQEDSKIYLLKGKWLNLENTTISVGPIDKVSLLEYTDPVTKEFKLYSKEEITYLQGIFSDNKSLLRIDNLPVTPSVTSLEYIFYGCENLETLNFKGLDFSRVTRYEGTFQGCSKLKNIIGPFSGIIRSISFGDCPLTVDSILTVFDALAVDHGNNRSITISEETYNVLTQEQLSIPEEKGWAVIIE